MSLSLCFILYLHLYLYVYLLTWTRSRLSSGSSAPPAPPSRRHLVNHWSMIQHLLPGSKLPIVRWFKISPVPSLAKKVISIISASYHFHAIIKISVSAIIIFESSPTCQSCPLCCIGIVWSPSSLPRLGNAWQVQLNLWLGISETSTHRWFIWFPPATHSPCKGGLPAWAAFCSGRLLCSPDPFYIFACFPYQSTLGMIFGKVYLGLWAGTLFYTPLPHFLLDFLVHVFQLTVVLVLSIW